HSHNTYSLYLHDALPILIAPSVRLIRETLNPPGLTCSSVDFSNRGWEYNSSPGEMTWSAIEVTSIKSQGASRSYLLRCRCKRLVDRKSTRLNSSHLGISY